MFAVGSEMGTGWKGGEQARQAPGQEATACLHGLHGPLAVKKVKPGSRTHSLSAALQGPRPPEFDLPALSPCPRGAPGPLSDVVPGIHLPGRVPASGDGAADPSAGAVQSM